MDTTTTAKKPNPDVKLEYIPYALHKKAMSLAAKIGLRPIEALVAAMDVIKSIDPKHPVIADVKQIMASGVPFIQESNELDKLIDQTRRMINYEIYGQENLPNAANFVEVTNEQNAG